MIVFSLKHPKEESGVTKKDVCVCVCVVWWGSCYILQRTGIATLYYNVCVCVCVCMCVCVFTPKKRILHRIRREIKTNSLCMFMLARESKDS